MNNELNVKDYQIASDLKKQLLNQYGSLIEQIYCYGSRVYAKKDDADFDILIVTNRRIDWQEERVIYKDIFRLGLEKDIQLHLLKL